MLDGIGTDIRYAMIGENVSYQEGNTIHIIINKYMAVWIKDNINHWIRGKNDRNIHTHTDRRRKTHISTSSQTHSNLTIQSHLLTFPPFLPPSLPIKLPQPLLSTTLQPQVNDLLLHHHPLDKSHQYPWFKLSPRRPITRTSNHPNSSTFRHSPGNDETREQKTML